MRHFGERFFIFAIVFISGFRAFPAVVHGTLIKTEKGLKSVEQLKMGDRLVAYSPMRSFLDVTIETYKKSFVDEIVLITTNQGTIEAAPTQVFYDPRLNAWIKATELNDNNTFLTSKLSLCHCLRTERQKKRCAVYAIEVQDPHVMFISPLEVLTHNELISIGITIAFCMEAIAVTGLSIGIGGIFAHILDEAGRTFSWGRNSNYSTIPYEDRDGHPHLYPPVKLPEVSILVSPEVLKNSGNRVGCGARPESFKHPHTEPAPNLTTQPWLTADSAKESDSKPEVKREVTQESIKERRKRAAKKAKEFGFKETKNYDFDSHGEKVYQRGNTQITLDQTSHKGGFWKMFSRGERQREGTYDENLSKRIGK